MADEPIDAGTGWSDPEQVRWYVERISRLEARQQGERMLVDLLPAAPQRVLDLGCGDGVLAALALAHRPSVTEVVTSATPARHAEFLAAIGREVDDPEDRLASVEDQVRWMADAGLVDADCLWRWRGFALLVGDAPPGRPEVDRVVAAQMHEGEEPSDVDLVRALLAEQFPAWARLRVERVTSTGTDYAVYRLGTDLAVRLPRIGWAVDQVHRDADWLPRVGPMLPVAVPEPVAVGEPGCGYRWPWAVHRWVPGENPVPGAVADPDGLAADLAGLLNAFRRIDLPGGRPARRGLPLTTQDEAARRAVEALGDQVDTAAVLQAWEEALDVPLWTGPPTWIHGDLSPGNLLCVDDRLHAVIDFGCLGVGDPAVDLIVAWNLLPASARPGFRTVVDVDDATWVRGRGWALSIALIQLPYYEHTNPDLAVVARRTVAEVLADC